MIQYRDLLMAIILKTKEKEPKHVAQSIQPINTTNTAQGTTSLCITEQKTNDSNETVSANISHARKDNTLDTANLVNIAGSIRDSNSVVDMDTREAVSDIILNALSNLQDGLLADSPNISSHIITIHKAMKDDPHQVVIMSEEQKAVFFAGLMKATNNYIVATTKGAKKSKASNVSIDVDDI